MVKNKRRNYRGKFLAVDYTVELKGVGNIKFVVRNYFPLTISIKFAK